MFSKTTAIKAILTIRRSNETAQPLSSAKEKLVGEKAAQNEAMAKFSCRNVGRSVSAGGTPC